MSEITITGLVATTPRHLVTQDGLPITSFRLASEADDNTNWFTITSFRALAVNVAMSASKGDRVVITGNLRIRDWDNGERGGTSVEVEATSIGHDMNYGSSVFTRTTYTPNATPAQDLPAPHSCSCNNCGV
jgi:single-strand DNA-binding protein